MKNILFLSIIAMITCGCSFRNGAEKCSECSETVELNGSRVPVEDSLMMGGFIVRCLDDNSAVIRYFGRPFILGYLSLSDCSVKPLVYSGRGPGEMLDACEISYTGLSDSGHRIVGLSDINMKKHFVIDVDAYVQMEKTIPSNTWSVFRRNGGFLYKVSTDEDGLSYIEESGDGSMQTLASLYPQDAFNKYYHYVQSVDSMRPDGDKVAMCMLNMDKVYLLDLTNGSKTSIVTDPGWRHRDDLLEAERQSGGGSEDHYMNACCDADNIYALHYPGNELRVFDWKGNYVRCIHLDHSLVSISVSPSRQLYGTDMEEGLFRYDLNNVLTK